jgi:hypothetical protein
MHLSVVVVLVWNQAEVCLILCRHVLCSVTAAAVCAASSMTCALLLDRGHVGQVQCLWDHKEKGEGAPVWHE